MTKFTIPLFLLSVFIIGIVVISDVTSKASDNKKIPSLAAMPMGHNHPPLPVDGWELTPTVGISAKEDSMTGGWNLKVDVQHFTFSPEDVNTPSRKNTGHAHLYIDGEKSDRLYSKWVYIDRLPSGKHTLKVTLNSNMHEELTMKGTKIEAQTTITQRQL